MLNETINEMVRILREGKRMCESYENCTKCEAAHIDCNFNATNEDLAELMKIVDAWSIAHPKEEQQEEAKQQGEAGGEQNHNNNTLEGRVDHLEKYVCEINEKLSLFIRDTVEKIEEIDGRIARQNVEKELHEQLGVLSNIAKDSANTPPKKRTRKVYHTPATEPSQTQEQKRTNKDVLLAAFPNVDTSACPKVLDMNYKCDKRKLCAVCKHEFWNEEVEG